MNLYNIVLSLNDVISCNFWNMLKCQTIQNSIRCSQNFGVIYVQYFWSQYKSMKYCLVSNFGNTNAEQQLLQILLFSFHKTARLALSYPAFSSDGRDFRTANFKSAFKNEVLTQLQTDISDLKEEGSMNDGQTISITALKVVWKMKAFCILTAQWRQLRAPNLVAHQQALSGAAIMSLKLSVLQ